MNINRMMMKKQTEEGVSKNIHHQKTDSNQYKRQVTKLTECLIKKPIIYNIDVNEKKVEFPKIRIMFQDQKSKNKRIRDRLVKKSREKDILNILSIVNKELSIEKRRYFETISSQEALIIKSKANNSKPLTFRGNQNSNSHDQILMTPKFTERRSMKKIGSETIDFIGNRRFKFQNPEKTAQETKFLQREQQIEGFSPWSIKQPDQCF